MKYLRRLRNPRVGRRVDSQKEKGLFCKMHRSKRDTGEYRPSDLESMGRIRSGIIRIRNQPAALRFKINDPNIPESNRYQRFDHDHSKRIQRPKAISLPISNRDRSLNPTAHATSSSLAAGAQRHKRIATAPSSAHAMILPGA